MSATLIVGILCSVLGLVSGVVKYLNSDGRQRRIAKKSVREEKKAMEAGKREIMDAVYGDDDARVNAIAQRLLRGASASATLVVFAAFLGCRTGGNVYVPTDRRIETCTNSIGIVCKAVPNAVFADLLVRLQEAEDAKASAAVEKRISK